MKICTNGLRCPTELQCGIGCYFNEAELCPPSGMSREYTPSAHNPKPPCNIGAIDKDQSNVKEVK